MGRHECGMKDLIPFVGNRKARERVDEVFSRKTIGSVGVMGAAGKIIETCIILITAPTPTTPYELAGWISAFVLFLYLFAYWEQLDSKKDDAVDAASDTIDDVTDTVTDAIDGEDNP